MGDEATTREHRAHNFYMSLALSCARKSPPKPTNFCVGAVLVDSSKLSQDQTVGPTDNEQALHDAVLTTGYTLECEGNTHAEQCCFLKLASQHDCSEEDIGLYLPEVTVLYTTMEPCNKRSVGNLPCVDRILRLKREDGTQALSKVYVGVTEPETFVGVNEGRRRLEEAEIEVEHVPGFEEEILAVATAGHEKDHG